MSPSPSTTQHPTADVPQSLFDDPDKEARWRRRFSAVRISLPHWARDEPDRVAYVSNATGRFEVSCWDLRTDTHTRGDRPARRHRARHAVGRRRRVVVVRRHGGRRVRGLAGAAVRQPRICRRGPVGAARGRARLPGRPRGRQIRCAGRFLRRRRNPRPPVHQRCASLWSSTGTPRTAASARCPRTRASGCCRIPSTATPGIRRCGRSRCRPAR